MAGFIKIYRQLEKWEWYTDTNTKSLFIHCLIQANHRDNKWRGITVKAGSFVTSYEKLAVETGLSVREVRTSLKRLKSTNEITHETTSQYSVISIVKWANYQGYDKQSDIQNDTVSDMQDDKQVTSERQASDNQTTTNKNDKNIKNEKNKELTICKTSDLLQIFEREFKRPLTQMDIQKICDWESKVGYDYVIHALRECIIYNTDGKKLNTNYLDSILVGWLNRKITLEMLNAGEWN